MGPVPASIGKYEHVQELGQGGFAFVYKATDPALNRDVAIKVLRPGWVHDPKMVRRFHREAQSTATLRHPHIVAVHEIGTLDSGQTYIVMEYLPGRPLSELLQQQHVLSPSQTLTILWQVGQALDYLHGEGLVHRDVSPKNVMVERKRDGGLHCVLTDLGLVKILADEESLTSGPLGTVEYMAPEQIVTSRRDEISPATDIYAFGVMAYRMLTGRLPFAGNPASVLVSHLQDEPPDPCTFCEEVSPQTAAVLLRALSKDPADRQPSAGETVDALVSALSIDRAASVPAQDLPQMVRVPGGAFWMGSDERDNEAATNEKPIHEAHLSEYFIAKYPVTNAQYATFVLATGHPPPEHWHGGQVPPGREDHPVSNVSHDEARAYCRWLSETTGRAFRLPTEYEWEKAARGGAPEMRRYPWGHAWQAGQCNCLEEGRADTTAVSRFESTNRSPFGVVDMVGNVWEWTDSEYRPYPGSRHYSASYAGTYVVRGGSWRNPSRDARIPARGRYKPDVRRAYLGFRVVHSRGAPA